MRKTLILAALALLASPVRGENLDIWGLTQNLTPATTVRFFTQAASGQRAQSVTLAAIRSGTVPTTRTITCSPPLKCAGVGSHDLSSDFTITVDAATTSTLGTVVLATSSSDTTAGHAIQANDPRVSVDASAGTGSARTLGAGAQQAAAGNHGHAAGAITGLALSATTDTTNASNISSGTLLVARGGTGTGSTLTGLVRGSGSAMTAAELSGDASTSGSNAVTVSKLNGVALSGLATGILKNTTGTGVPSIAVAGDFPTLNQNTSGSAASLSTTNDVPHGGTGVAMLVDHGTVLAHGTGVFTASTPGTAGFVWTSNGSSSDSSWQAPAGGSSPTFKNADQAKFNDATLANDNVFATSISTGTYRITAWLWVTAGSTQGFKVNLNFTGSVAGVQGLWRSSGMLLGSASSESWTDTDNQPFAVTGSDSIYVTLTATVIATSSGTLSIQWAQAVSGSPHTVVSKLSWWEVQ